MMMRGVAEDENQERRSKIARKRVSDRDRIEETQMKIMQKPNVEQQKEY